MQAKAATLREGENAERKTAYRVGAAGAEPPKRANDPAKNVHHDVSPPLRDIAVCWLCRNGHTRGKSRLTLRSSANTSGAQGVSPLPVSDRSATTP